MIGLPLQHPYAPERWALASGYAHPYEVSTHGRVYSPYSERFLTGYHEPRGLVYDLMLCDGRRRWIYAGRLVMETFMPVSNMTGRKVLYLNGDCHDAHIENLIWSEGRKSKGWGMV